MVYDRSHVVKSQLFRSEVRETTLARVQARDSHFFERSKMCLSIVNESILIHARAAVSRIGSSEVNYSKVVHASLYDVIVYTSTIALSGLKHMGIEDCYIRNVVNDDNLEVNNIYWWVSVP